MAADEPGVGAVRCEFHRLTGRTCRFAVLPEVVHRLSLGLPEPGAGRVDSDGLVETLYRFPVSPGCSQGNSLVVPEDGPIAVLADRFIVALDRPVVLPLLSVCAPLPAPGLDTLPGKFHPADGYQTPHEKYIDRTRLLPRSGTARSPPLESGMSRPPHHLATYTCSFIQIKLQKNPDTAV